MSVNNRSKNPKDWSVSKLIKEAGNQNPKVTRYFESDDHKKLKQQAVDAVRRYRKEWDALIEKIVPGYCNRSQQGKDRGLAEFCARLARDFNLRPLEVLSQSPTMVEGMVDAMQSDSPPKQAEPIALDDTRLTYDGLTHTLTDEQAVLMSELIKAAGRFISMADLNKPPHNLGRSDRIKQNLPDEIKALIESKTGRGSRLICWDNVE